MQVITDVLQYLLSGNVVFVRVSMHSCIEPLTTRSLIWLTEVHFYAFLFSVGICLLYSTFFNHAFPEESLVWLGNLFLFSVH